MLHYRDAIELQLWVLDVIKRYGGCAIKLEDLHTEFAKRYKGCFDADVTRDLALLRDLQVVTPVFDLVDGKVVGYELGQYGRWLICLENSNRLSLLLISK